jgi:hypothetical protein
VADPGELGAGQKAKKEPKIPKPKVGVVDVLLKDISFMNPLMKGGDHAGFGEAALCGQTQAGGAAAEPVRFGARLPGLPEDHLLNVVGPPLKNRPGRPPNTDRGHRLRLPKTAGVDGKAIRDCMLAILREMKAIDHCSDDGPTIAAISAWERELEGWQPRGRR